VNTTLGTEGMELREKDRVTVGDVVPEEDSAMVEYYFGCDYKVEENETYTVNAEECCKALVVPPPAPVCLRLLSVPRLGQFQQPCWEGLSSVPPLRTTIVTVLHTRSALSPLFLLSDPGAGVPGVRGSAEDTHGVSERRVLIQNRSKLSG